MSSQENVSVKKIKQTGVGVLKDCLSEKLGADRIGGLDTTQAVRDLASTHLTTRDIERTLARRRASTNNQRSDRAVGIESMNALLPESDELCGAGEDSRTHNVFQTSAYRDARLGYTSFGRGTQGSQTSSGASFVLPHHNSCDTYGSMPSHHFEPESSANCLRPKTTGADPQGFERSCGKFNVGSQPRDSLLPSCETHNRSPPSWSSPTPGGCRVARPNYCSESTRRWIQPTPIDERTFPEATPLLRSLDSMNSHDRRREMSARMTLPQYTTARSSLTSRHNVAVSRRPTTRRESCPSATPTGSRSSATGRSLRQSVLHSMKSVLRFSRGASSPYDRQMSTGIYRPPCRPSDPVPYNPASASPAEMEDQKRRVHDQKATASSAHLFAYLLVALVLWTVIFGFTWPTKGGAYHRFTSLLPTSKTTANLPIFCSYKRQITSACIQCPRQALCVEGRAECPTYFALEQVSADLWECKSYESELERIAEEGFSRMVSYLRKIEKPVICRSSINGKSISAVQSRLDILELFDMILLPMLDERQKGLKDGLLQMYLTLLGDEKKLEAVDIEKNGSLHVTLASIASRKRLACYLPSWQVLGGALGGLFVAIAAYSLR